jgi:putative beta-lysine N-acetyltransferase
LYRRVFASYPFPVDEPDFLRDAMRNGTVFSVVVDGERVVAAASAEPCHGHPACELTDFATSPEHRGKGHARRLLRRLEREVADAGVRTAFTIARATSVGMNAVFLSSGYTLAGTLVNNTQIMDDIESMHVWYRHL